MKIKGQALIESTIIIFLVLFISFETFRIFKITTENILAEAQLIDLLKNGIIKNRNIIGLDKTNHKRDVGINDIETEVHFNDGKAKKSRLFTR